jgi:glutamyl-Q tRNA(Asp) synthetase
MNPIHNCITRFAPSPTGRLHLGHAWSALQVHDFARANGGQFRLRIEDIDPGRCRAEFVDGIYEDLRWLGLEWDGEVWVQSERLPHYRAALDQLIAGGFVYRCWCTRAEIAQSADAVSVYPGTCRGRPDPGDGLPFSWRLDAAKAVAAMGGLDWTDSRAGRQAVNLESQGDVILFRKDAPASYHLAVTLDDAAQGVTDVVRGMDLFASTHVHRLLQALLGLPTPHYHHHALIIGADGTRLAKRKQSPTLAALRADGIDPLRLIDGMREGRFPFGFALEEA